MSTQQKLQQFFSTKNFEVPQYQRSYSWERENVRELYEDIVESIETGSSHYIGTFVLAKTKTPLRFNIVDGQQRLTTIIMFLSVVLSRIKNENDRAFWQRYYVGESNKFKLTPLLRDATFFYNLLSQKANLEPQSKSQRYLRDAHDEMCNIMKKTAVAPEEILEAVGRLDVLEFIEENESDAIRIFQTVNDRGKDLTKTDKMKSLLYYFSNKYCLGRYDDLINDHFADIFELYDKIKLIGELEGINVISSKQFTEDDLLRSHHVCFSEESYDPTAQEVLNNIKFKLFKLRKEARFEALGGLISAYLSSLRDYVQAFADAVSLVPTNPTYFRIFVVLGLSSALYPVIAVLNKKKYLEHKVPIKNVTLIDLIEIIDLRVMKVRQYAGRKEIANFCYNVNTTNIESSAAIASLLSFNSRRISDDKFRDFLASYDYVAQTGLLRTLFMDKSEKLHGKKFDVHQLKKMMESEPTVEHILSQTPNFKPKAFGFKSSEDYEEWKGVVGNLTLLERRLNSSINNGDLSEKIKGYSKSQFRVTSQLATELSMSNAFAKEDLKRRNVELVREFASRWWA